jgi:hypothetical protein
MGMSSRDAKRISRGQNVCNIENRQFATLSASASQTILQGPLPVVPTTGFLTISGTVMTYIGYTQKQLVVDYVRFIGDRCSGRYLSCRSVSRDDPRRARLHSQNAHGHVRERDPRQPSLRARHDRSVKGNLTVATRWRLAQRTCGPVLASRLRPRRHSPRLWA